LRIFSTAEQTFFDTIVDDLGEEFYVLSNVPFMDVLEPDRSATKSESRTINKIYANHFFDFVISKRD